MRESSSPAPLIIQEQYTMTRSTNSPTLVLEIVAMVFHKLNNGADTNCSVVEYLNFKYRVFSANLREFEAAEILLLIL